MIISKYRVRRIFDKWVIESLKGGEKLALPNFGFLFTDMPSWSKKPRTATVIYFNHVIFNDECINGQNRQSGCSAGAPHVPQDPVVFNFAEPPTPTPQYRFREILKSVRYARLINWFSSTEYYKFRLN